MNGRPVTFPSPWYQKCALCNRRKTCTTAICLIALTTCFSYLACHKYGWSIRVINENPTIEAVNSKNFEKLSSEPVHNPANIINPWITGDSRAKQESQTEFSSIKRANSPQQFSQVLSSTTQSRRPSIEARRVLALNSDKNPDFNSIKGRLALDRQVFNTDVTDNYSAVDIIPFDYPENTAAHSQPLSTDVSDQEKNIRLTDNATELRRLESGVHTAVLETRSPSLSSDTFKEINIPVSVNSSSFYDEKDYFEEIQYDSESDTSSWDNGGVRQSSNATHLTAEKDIVYENRKYLNILNTKPLPCLDTYKNPCWMEDHVETWYMDNYYLDVENVRNVLTRMSAILRLRQERGDYHRIRCLPYFLIIGQPKCGSTDLYEKLVSHPETVRPPTKEPHWWSRARLGRHRSIGNFLSLEDYTDVFDYSAYTIEQHPIVSPDSGRVYHRMITGEGSMSTFWDNDNWSAMVGNENLTEPRVLIPDYIRHLLPDVKLIIILRNPTTRLYSDYLYFAKDSKTPSDFHTDVVNGIAVFENCTKQMTLRSCTYNRTVNMLTKVRLRVGLYAVFLEDWFRVFPRERFYIVRTEEYAATPRNVLKALFKFLDLNQLSTSHEDRILSRQKANTRRAKDKAVGDMLPETRVILDNFYRPLNTKLAKLMNDDGYLWQEKDIT